MARAAVADYLQTYRFQLYDSSPVGGVFMPLAGFESISIPQMAVETQQIDEANWQFQRSVIRKANVAPMMLRRGVTWSDADFWNWIISYVQGTPVSTLLGFVEVNPRRDLILVQFMRAGLVGDLPGFEWLLEMFSVVHSGEKGSYMPGKIWYLKDCVPIRYRAGSDLSAGRDEISISEVEVRPSYFEELSLGTLFPQGAELLRQTMEHFL